MHRPNRSRWSLGAIGTSLMLFLAACGTQGTSSAPSASTGGEASAPPPSASSGGDVAEIEWYVGLGTGTNPEQIPVQEEQVDQFNADHPNIHLTLTVVDSEQAEQDLATRMPTNPPDIIGPIGIRGLQGFGDTLLDLTSYIEEAGIDRSSIEDALWDVYQLDGKQIGVPMAVYPSFIYYNKGLFDEAELAYPPHEVGEQYEGEDWTWETVRDLAMKLTVDANGNDATSADFDPSSIEVWGLDAQFTNNDPRAWSTIFGGSGSIVADDGTTAQWPDNWREGLQFF
jgi:multiple sugar transport system substrate-binding protein